MKKIITVIVLSTISFTINAQVGKGDLKMVKMDKTVPLQTTTRKPVFTFVPPTDVNVFPDITIQKRMPDNQQLTIKLTKQIANMPKNLGGNVKETINSQSIVSEGNFDKKTTMKTINAESTTFMDVNISQQASRIYPGAIYKCAEFFAGGMALNTGRNPYIIYADNTNNTSGSLFATVTDAQPASCYQAVSNITTKFSNTTGSANLQYRCYRSTNDADLSIKVAASGAYAGFSANGGYNLTTKETTLFLTIDAIKPMYTISTQIPANGYLTDKNTEAAPNLMVINSVTYGTRILANLKVTIKQRSDDVNFAARYGVTDASFVSALFGLVKGNNSVESTINAFVVGGPRNTATFSRENLEQEINNLLSQCNYQTAQPISYTFSDVYGNQLGAQSATDVFADITSVPKDRVYKCAGAAVEIMTADDNKENGSDVQVTLKNNAGIVVVQDKNNTEFTNGSTNTIGLNIDPNNSNALLSNFQNGNNNELHIFLDPKQILFGWDAWNIKKVKLILTFTDQFGNPGNVFPIEMNNSNVRLEKNKQRLVCTFNSSFQAISSSQPQ